MINLRSSHYNNFENAALMLLENGATIDELKTQLEIIVEIRNEAADETTRG